MIINLVNNVKIVYNIKINNNKKKYIIVVVHLIKHFVVKKQYVNNVNYKNVKLVVIHQIINITFI